MRVILHLGQKPYCDVSLVKLFEQSSIEPKQPRSLTPIHLYRSRATGVPCELSFRIVTSASIISSELVPSITEILLTSKNIPVQKLITHADSIMDLLQSLIVPPTYPNPPRDSLSRDPRLSYNQTTRSGQASAERSPLVPPAGPAPHQPPEQESSSTPIKPKKKRKKKKKKQNHQPVLTRTVSPSQQSCRAQQLPQMQRSANSTISSTPTDPKAAQTKEHASLTKTSTMKSQPSHQFNQLQILRPPTQTPERRRPAFSGTTARASDPLTGMAAS